MGFRYIGRVISPSVNPLAANVTTSPNVAQYNGVFSLEDQSQALTSGQWATEPNFKQTTLLLHADGKANGAQNNTFLDSSTNAFAITRNGDTTQGTFTPFSQSPGWWGNYFSSANNSYLSFANSADFQFSTGDFTIECWVNIAAIGSAQSIFSGLSGTGTTTGFEFGFNGSGYLYLDTYVGSTEQTITATNNVLTANTWNHVAVTNTSGTFRLFVNGTSCTFSGSISQAVGCGSNAVEIGHMEFTGYPHWLTAYVSNLRVVKGTSMYSSNFTPSTIPLTAVTNTKLLTCQSNYFVDANTQVTAKTVTVSGTPSVQAFSPFAPQYTYTAAQTGGSGYFDGTGDYLSVADSSAFTLGTNNFTIEAWVYPITYVSGSDTYSSIICQSDNGSVSLQSFDVLMNSSGQVLAEAYIGASYITITSTALPKNAWSHIAFVRNGSTFTLYVNGVSSGTPVTNAGSLNDSARTITIGATQTPFRYWNGYIADARIVNGTAIVPPAGGPTSPLTAVANTAFLCSFTNAGIIDSTSKNDLQTVGDAQVSTAVVKYGSGSIKFDGTGDYLYRPSGASTVTTLAGDFTIEGWCNRTSGGFSLICVGDDYTSTGIHVYYSTGNNAWNVGIGNSSRMNGGSTATGTWIHVACVRQNGIVKLFVDGVQMSTVYSTTSTFSGNLYVGAELYNGTIYSTTNGYIDEARITNGVARYTSNFVPPKVAFANQ